MIALEDFLKVGAIAEVARALKAAALWALRSLSSRNSSTSMGLLGCCHVLGMSRSHAEAWPKQPTYSPCSDQHRKLQSFAPVTINTGGRGLMLPELLESVIENASIQVMDLTCAWKWFMTVGIRGLVQSKTEICPEISPPIRMFCAAPHAFDRVPSWIVEMEVNADIDSISPTCFMLAKDQSRMIPSIPQLAMCGISDGISWYASELVRELLGVDALW